MISDKEQTVMTSQAKESESAVTSSGTSSPTGRPSLSYMHRPPAIMPNYGKKYGTGLKLKTNVPRVLLYDNVTQQTILDVQLSGLQSQQYKISREMENHKKSFQLRRQEREKALEKLTKVHHREDYEEFERDFYNSMQNSDTYRFLPSISNGNSIMNRTPRKKRKRNGSKTKDSVHFSKNGTSNSVVYFRSQDSIESRYVIPNGSIEVESENNNYRENTQTTLPRIDSSSPHSLVSAKGQDTEVKSAQSQNFEPKGRVGYREEKLSSGVTRIFHSLPADDQEDENADDPSLLNGQNATRKSEEEAEDKANASLPDNSNVSVPMDTNQAEVPNLPKGQGNMEGSQGQTQGQGQEQGEARDGDVTPEAEFFSDGQTQPLFDRRFEMLRKLLVRQEPPNEGYTELSPSYPRRYPDIKPYLNLSHGKNNNNNNNYNNNDYNDYNDNNNYNYYNNNTYNNNNTTQKKNSLSVRKTEKSKERRRKGRREHGELSEGETPSLSGEPLSDSEDEERANVNDDDRANSGLVRLGQF